MGSLTIATADGELAFNPGDEVRVDLAWQLPEAPEKVELRLVWHTEGKGTPDQETVDQVRIDDPREQQTVQLAIRLPDGPYSFSGKLISLIWSLELVVFPSRQSERLDIVIGPGRREVVLGQAVPHESS